MLRSKKNKINKEKFRKNLLIVVSIFVAIFCVSIWTSALSNFGYKEKKGVVFDASKQRIDKADIPEKNDKDIVNEKNQNNIEEYSCDVENDEFIKGFIRVISDDYLVITDKGSEYRIYLKPETVFVNAYMDNEKEIMQKEIQKETLGVNQDVVASILLMEEEREYSLFIKQILSTK